MDRGTCVESKTHTIERTVLAWSSASGLAPPLRAQKDTLFRQRVSIPVRELAHHDTSSFEFLYCDGLVHRISRGEAVELFKACFRVLKPLGLLRVTTFDIDRLVHGYLFDWTDNSTIEDGSRTQKLNAAFRQPNIVFLYGEEELMDVLAQAGFEQIRRFGVGSSSDERFWNLESDRTHSLILEASKA